MIGSGLGLNGSNYAILVGGGDGLSGFLIDDYGGAAAAYSLRKLSASYSGPAIRVREEGGNQESDIGFDSNGELDLATLATFCNGTVGRVVTWYDQSSNANHVTQSTASFQPLIYNSTSVITINGNPGLSFLATNNSSMFSSANIGISGTGDRTNFIVAECDNISGNTESTVMSYGGGGAGEAWQHTFEPWIRVGSGYQSFSGTTANTQHLLTTALWSGTNVTDSSMFIDGSAATAGAASSRTLNTTDSTLKLGAGSSGAPLFSGTIHEVLVWASDQSTNRTAIEDNINSEYLIYQPTTTPESGLLADYSGAAAAYSVRRLSDKAVVAMRIRRDSDNAEINIGFNADGSLDTTAISDFCTTANGYVVEWMDQSTNGNHATQSTAGNQPQIYNGTAVITENGKPALYPNGTGYFSGSYSISDGFTATSVFTHNNESTQYILGSVSGILKPAVYFSGRTFRIFGGSYADVGTAPAAQALYTAVYDAAGSGNIVGRINQSETVSATATSYTAGTSMQILAGGSNNSPAAHTVQEIVVWSSNQRSAGNIASIESNINSEYLIHQPTEAPTTGLLADYSGAAAAYSVRRLSDKAVIAMRIRRDSDNAEINIGFDSNGDLDTQAIIDFCGVANGRVVQWMDQSTNGNHAVMTTQSLQPQIYDGSSINEINGKPAIDNESINTSGVGFTLSGVSVTQPYTIQSVFAVKANKIGGTYAWSSLPLPYLRNDIGNDSFSVIGGGNFTFSTANGNSVTNPAQDCQVSKFISADATNLEIFVSSNNAQESGTTTSTVTTYTPTYLTNRRVGDISNYHFQEYILWDSDYTGDQSSIENNINSYFSIHQ